MQDSKLIISVAEAREILGESAKNISDTEIAKIISLLDALAADALKLASEQSLPEIKYGRQN